MEILLYKYKRGRLAGHHLVIPSAPVGGKKLFVNGVLLVAVTGMIDLKACRG